jgi:hypothetical protein
MKKVLSLLALIALTINCGAQAKDFMLNKANEKLKQKQTEKAAVDSTKQQPQTNTQPQQPGFMGTFTPVAKSDIRSEYNFTDNIVVEVKTYKKNGEQNGETQKVKYLFGKDSYFGMEMDVLDEKKKTSTKMVTVAELDKSITVMLSDDGSAKTGYALRYDYNKAMAEAGDTTKNKTTITKTGRSKSILGFKCEEYLMTNEKGEKTECWFTSEVSLDLFKSMAAFSKGRTSTGGYPNGFMMESTSYASNGEKTEWKVIQVNLGVALQILTAAYTFAGM